MTGISSSIGLISGINTAQLIDQLIAIDSQPKILAQNRMAQLQSQQAAFLAFNADLLSLKTAAEAFRVNKVFDTKTATSSDSNILSATATTSAQPGTFQFIVDRLVASSQNISKGFVDADATALGGTEISFELGKGRVQSTARLTDLNGGNGIARGKIKITDSSGASTTIDLTKAVSLNDVIGAINSDTTVTVTATVSGDGLKITDGAGGTSELTIADDAGSTTATDLGIAAKDSEDGNLDGIITGKQIQKIAGGTALRALNDGNGVLINSGQDITDFTITDKSGASHLILLGDKSDGNGGTIPGVTTIQGVIDQINADTAGAVTASIGADGVSLLLTDATGGGGTLSITKGPNGDQILKDLGLTAAAAGNTITGTRLLTAVNSVLLKSLNGGTGLAGATTLDITDRLGATTSINVTSATSLNDILDLVNNDATVNVTATLNQTGTGIQIKDNTGSTTSNLIVTNNAAAALQIDTGSGGVASDTVKGTNLQFQYVAASSLLTDLNYGRGIATGTFTITDSEGLSSDVIIDKNDKTLQDVIANINSRPTKIIAAVNSTGDGLILTPEPGATLSTPISVTSSGGNTAKDLNILRTATGADAPNNFIDGSYEQKIALDATDNLNDVINKINAAGIPVSATLINDGGANPFRLSLNSEVSGTAGDLITETKGFDLALTALTKAQDSVVFFGSKNPQDGILITSTTNTINDVIAGVNINLNGTSATPVELTVASDTQSIVDQVNKFVDAFNSVATRISSLDSFDPDTQQRGVLLGDPTLARIRSQLYRSIQGTPKGVSTQYTHLTQVGIDVGADGKLTFNEDRFRQALENDPTAVENVFSAYTLSKDQTIHFDGGATADSPVPIFDSLGVTESLAQTLNGLTNSVDGTLTTVNQNLDSLIGIQQQRIDNFDRQLADERKSLTQQFAAMESALATLQGQQAALGSLSTFG